MQIRLETEIRESKSISIEGSAKHIFSVIKKAKRKSTCKE